MGRQSNRSESTVTPWRPAAAASSGSRVPASRCQRSQVERSREAESRGCPGGMTSRSASELARFRDGRMPADQILVPSGGDQFEDLGLPIPQYRYRSGRRFPHTDRDDPVSADVPGRYPGHPSTVEPCTQAQGQKRPSRSLTLALG